ncbi:MAG TPA: zinc ribbon domain-containing protein, partial [Thermoplasmata archaeon]
MRALNRRIALSLVFGLVVVGALVAGLSAGSPSTPAMHSHSAAAAPASLVAPAATLHGNLIVSAANSPFIISPATTGSNSYAQAGNITVQVGGTLIVRHETVDFVQFVSNTGTLSERLGHIYSFTVLGAVEFENATVTTNASVINAYTKLTFNVSGGGSVSLVNSTFAFPGWLQVYGAGTTLHLDRSSITGNPAVLNAVENQSLLADSVWAPAVSASGGARVTLGNSSIVNYYKDNTTARGLPGPAPLTTFAGYSLSSASSQTLSNFPMPTDSENVTRAALYPSFAGGTVSLAYSSSVSSVGSGNTFSFGGTVYPLPTISYEPGNNLVLVPISAAAMDAINAVGPVGWMQATGSFEQASTIALHLGTTNQVFAVNVSVTSIYLTPVLSYNITVSGAGTTFTAADSQVDLNWNLTPGTPVSPGIAYPNSWGSNKLVLTGGASAYLASLSIAHPRTGVFWNDSVAIPDATSHAYFYRWAAIPVVSSGQAPIPDAQAVAFYSYDSVQSNNATATSLNNLAVADPDLAAYVQSFDAEHGLPGYGQSGLQGSAFLLLASTVLDQATLPDGAFLGGYHVAITLAGGGAGATQWGYVAVTPYPLGMTPATPDGQNSFVYSNYAPALSFGATTLLVQSLPVPLDGLVAIGQAVTFQALITNSGTGPVSSFNVNLSYVLAPPFAPLLIAPEQSFGPLAAGGQQSVSLTWIVNESVVGDHGYFTGGFLLSSSWNGGVAPNGGVVTQNLLISLAPAFINLTFTPPSGVLDSTTEYLGDGQVTFNGSGEATINLTAVASDGTVYLIGQDLVHSGPFRASVVIDPAMPAGTYSVVANATYNGRSVEVVTPNAFSIAGSPAAATPWWEQKILGIPILYWILIAAAIVGGVVAFLLLARRTARGKLVECGECGALIPEDATACPQCGAEFETDLVRCSRCGSTIPSDSEVCPECAAQLLGKPEEEARDPERQGYNDLVERFRAEAKKELGDNYSEGAFWDWWKRQQTYLSFSQWRLQQSQGGRSGMGAPP